MDEFVLVFDRSFEEIETLSDEEFLQAIRWTRSAPPGLAEAARRGEVETFSRLIVKNQWKPAAKQRAELLKSAGIAPDETDGLVEKFDRSGEPDRSATVAHSEGPTDSPEKCSPPENGRSPLSESLTNQNGTATAILPREAACSEIRQCWLERIEVLEACLDAERELSLSDCWSLWREALMDAARFTHEFEDFVLDPESDPRSFALAGELIYRYGLLFSGIKGAADWKKKGAKYLQTALLEGTDTDGTPDARLIGHWDAWLLGLTRSVLWSRLFQQSLWNAQADERFRDVVRFAAGTLLPEGRLTLAAEPARTQVVPALLAAARLSGWKKKSRIHRLLTAVDETRRAKPKKRKKLLDVDVTKKDRQQLPVTQSDWARLALMRSDWTVAADLVTIASRTEQPQLELVAHGVPLLRGSWGMEVDIEGESLIFQDDWACVCWHSTDEVDYLELQKTFEGDFRIERQILFSRQDQFLVMADCLSGGRDERVEYRSTLPFAAGVTGTADIRTREVVLNFNKRTARVFPLGLDQDRVMNSLGGLSVGEAGLELRQAGKNGLFAPIVIDWHPQRRRIPAQWRILTVTEERRILPRSEASGHRLRVGPLHLVVYRSLSQIEQPRAILGYHTGHETVIGQFDHTGSVTPLLLVD